MKVYVLLHERDLGEAEDVKLIGIYASDEEARAALARASRLPGFRETVDGFSVDELELGQDYWTGGFASLEGGEVAAERAA